MWQSLADRILSLFGVDPDFSVDLRAEFLSPITETLYLSARPDPDRVSELKEAGITHVVSLLPEEHRQDMTFLAKDFQHLFLGLHDGMNHNIRVHFSPFFDFAASPQSQLLVHCEVGVSRSATLVIAWLMKTRKLSFYQAFKQVQAKRAQILPNIGFASQLQLFEHELLGRGEEDELSSLARYLHQVCNTPVEIETLQAALARNDYDAVASLRMIFGEDIPSTASNKFVTTQGVDASFLALSFLTQVRPSTNHSSLLARKAPHHPG